MQLIVIQFEEKMTDFGEKKKCPRCSEEKALDMFSGYAKWKPCHFTCCEPCRFEKNEKAAEKRRLKNPDLKTRKRLFRQKYPLDMKRKKQKRLELTLEPIVYVYPFPILDSDYDPYENFA
jgi:hypothetical protein